MKNTLLKSALREIRHSRSRFLSILAIVAIGSGFFSGVKASCPDMKLTAETFFKEQNLADIHMLSTWGFEEEDLAAMVAEAETLEGSYSVDVLTGTASGDELVIKVISYNENAALNRPLLQEGRLPETENECVIGTSSMQESHWEIGETITVRADADEDLSETLSVTEYTVVGIAQLPQYFGYSYGTTTISDGTLDGFILVPEEDFCLDVWTDVYMTLPGTEGLDPFGDEYETLVSGAVDRLEEIGEVEAARRYQDVVDEANEEIADAETEIADGEKKLSDAEKELSDARTELDDGWQEYYDGKAEADQQIADAQAEIADAEKKLSDGEKQWQDGYDDYQSGLAQLADSREQLDTYIAQAEELEAQLSESRATLAGGRQLLTGLQAIQGAFAEQSVPDISYLDEQTKAVIDGSAALDESLPALLTGYVTTSGREKAQYAAGLSAALEQTGASLAAGEAQLAEGEAGLKQLQAGIESGEAEYQKGKEQLDEAKAELDSSKRTLEDNRRKLQDAKTELADKKAEAEAELSDALQELTDGEAEYEDGLAEYNEERPDAEQDIADAKEKIAGAKADLADLKQPSWYVFDRSSFPGVGTIADDAEKVDAIAAVFPVFFVLVAALVCLTTMTRMVEEQRTQIGTMKALGYGRGAVMLKYLLYASLASILGSVAGCLLGLKIFPMIIINCYKAMYQVPFILAPIRWGYLLGCGIVSILCTCGVTVLTCYGAMDTVPAQLMRPKAPKNGKRILLERVHFIWDKLSFSRKVTARNLFRYKSRVCMTIIGVAGCTALMLTGFGLRYAISSMAERQYGGVFIYDSALSVSDTASLEEVEDLLTQVESEDGVESAIAMTMKNVDLTAAGESVYSGTIYVPSEPEKLDGFISLRDKDSGTPLTVPEEGCVITAKLAKLLSLKEGDTLLLQNPDGSNVPLNITGVAENYVHHYVYITPESYEAIYGEEALPTTFFLQLSEGSNAGEAHRSLLKLDNVQGLIDLSYYADAFNDLVASLNLIVWVLIISAAALAIIVMYNLININVSERIRELATIKVLGFYDKEVSAYICRENSAAAFAGMLVGLGLGVFLEEFVVETAEVDVVMFIHGVPLSAFIFAAALTLFFVFLVNRIVHHSLKKINMVESLKSVE